MKSFQNYYKWIKTLNSNHIIVILDFLKKILIYIYIYTLPTHTRFLIFFKSSFLRFYMFPLPSIRFCFHVTWLKTQKEEHMMHLVRDEHFKISPKWHEKRKHIVLKFVSFSRIYIYYSLNYWSTHAWPIQGIFYSYRKISWMHLLFLCISMQSWIL